MLPTKKARELKVGDKLMGGEVITKITPTFNYHKMEYGYTVSINNPDGTRHHTGYDYTESSNIIVRI